MDYFRLDGCWVSIRNYGALVCNMRDGKKKLPDLKVTDDPKSIAAGKKLLSARKAKLAKVVALPGKNEMERLTDKVAAEPQKTRKSGVRVTKRA